MLLTTFFARRDCACLPRPVVEEAPLAGLSSASSSAAAAHLRPAFVARVAQLRGQVARLLAPKVLHGGARGGGKPLNGASFVAMLREYVTALNCGERDVFCRTRGLRWPRTTVPGLPCLALSGRPAGPGSRQTD
jgi:hypothetical protein